MVEKPRKAAKRIKEAVKLTTASEQRLRLLTPGYRLVTTNFRPKSQLRHANYFLVKKLLATHYGTKKL